MQNNIAIEDLGGIDDLTEYIGAVYVSATRIGYNKQFNAEYYGFESLHVNTPAANTYVEMSSLASNVEATIFGAAKVKIGTGKLSDNLGQVLIRTETEAGVVVPGQVPAGNKFSALTIDDTAQTTPMTFVLDTSTVTAVPTSGGRKLIVDFEKADLLSLTLSAGSGGNRVTVANTRTSAFVGPIAINSGNGTDAVAIQRIRTKVNVNGVSGPDTVNVGLLGSMQGITAPLYIFNEKNWSTINLDDTADQQARSVTMNVSGQLGSINGLAPATIRYRKTDLRALSVSGGSGNNSFSILETAQSTLAGGSPTSIYGGAGFDNISVLATTGSLSIDPQGDFNRITIGGRPGDNGNLDSIRANITLTSAEGVRGNVVQIIDRDNANPSLYIMEDQRFLRTNSTNGASTGNIYYGDLAMDGLTVFGSRVVGSQYFVNSTPGTNSAVVGGGVAIIAGNSDDNVTLFGNNGLLYVDLGDGANQNVVIGDSAHSLDSVQGFVRMSGRGSITTSISDVAATTSHYATFGSDVLGNETVERFETGSSLKQNTFQFAFANRNRIDYRAGQAGDTIHLFGVLANTVVVATGGAGYDVFTVGFGFDARKSLGPVTILSPENDASNS